MRVGLILAGGKGRRMGGVDKAVIEIGGRRLIDIVIDRLAPQVDHLLVAGPDDRGSGFEICPDREDGPLGPAAGLWSAVHSIAPDDTLLTVPVDAPKLPANLGDRLGDRLAAAPGCAVAQAGGRLHPTFAFWRPDALKAALSQCPSGQGVTLTSIIESTGATVVAFPDPAAFANINTPDDLAAFAAERSPDLSPRP